MNETTAVISLANTRILVVDDNPLLSGYVGELLQDAGAEVVTADSGERALAVLAEPQGAAFACALIDIDMPGMDGIETARRLRTLGTGEYAMLPLIAMLSPQSKVPRDRIFAGGMNGVVTKPVRPDDLYREVERCRHLTFLGSRDRSAELRGKKAYVFTPHGELSDTFKALLADIGLECTAVSLFEQVIAMANDGVRCDYAFVDWTDAARETAENVRNIALFGQNTFQHLIIITPDWSQIEAEASSLAVDAYIGVSPSRLDILNVLQRIMQADDFGSRQNTEDFSGSHFLVVDDNEMNADILGDALEAFGASVDIVNSGTEALKLLREAPEHSYTMAFIDIFMPDLKGFDVAETFRRLERSDAMTLVIIGISGNTDVQLVEQAIRSGMNALMLKPINRKSLLAYMNIFLKEENVNKLLVSRMQTQLADTRNDFLKAQYKAEMISYLVNNQDSALILDYIARHLLQSTGADIIRIRLAGEGENKVWCAPGVTDDCCNCNACSLTDNEHASVACPTRRLTYVRKITVMGTLYGRLILQRPLSTETASPLSEQLLQEAADIITMALERQDYIAKLQKERDAALAAEKAKMFFFAMVSHDIRTPLNAIIGSSQLLQLGVDDPEERKLHLGNIVTGGNALMNLVNDVIDLAKLDANQVPFSFEFCDFAEEADRILKLCRLDAERKQLSHTVDIASMPRVRIDAQRIRQIILNLVGNAIKYTASGSVGFAARFEHVDNPAVHQGNLVFAVTDTGAGIAPQNLERLKQAFVQYEGIDQTAGTGLGLPICFKLLERMNGCMDIKSEVGQGSTFTVTLMNVDCEEEVAEAASSAPASETVPQVRSIPENYRDWKVLLVDDAPMNLTVLKALCKRFGFTNITTAKDGQEGLDLLLASPFDFVITDIWMPVMRGDELVKRIRQEPSLAGLPVYALTADAEAVRNYQKCGFNDILFKPLNVAKLQELIDRVLSAC